MLPKAELGEYQRPRGRPPRARGRRRAGRAGDRRRCASASRACRPPSVPPPSRRLRRDRLRRLARRLAEDRATPGERAGRGSRFAGGEGRDQLVELGGGNLIPGFEEGLLGASAGETRTVALTLPRRLRQRASSPDARRRSRSTVKEVKLKELPERRRGLRDRRGLRRPARSCARTSAAACSRPSEARIEAEFRQAALDAAVAGAAGRAHARARQGAGAGDVGADAALALPPRHLARGLPADHRPRGGRDPRRDGARSRAGAAPRGGDHRDRRRRGHRARPSEELLEALAPTAEREGIEPPQLLEDLRTAGRLEEVREDLAARQAIDLIADARQADPARAGAGARAAVDAREGGSSRRARRTGRRRPAQAVDPDRSGIGQLAF